MLAWSAHLRFFKNSSVVGSKQISYLFGARPFPFSDLFLSHLVPTKARVVQWELLGYLHAQPTTGSFQLSHSFMSSAITLSIPCECSSAGVHRTLCRHNMQHLAAGVENTPQKSNAQGPSMERQWAKMPPWGC